MKELQTLLGETNRFLAHTDVEIGVPLIHTGMLYELSDTTLGMTQTVGRMEEIGNDYSRKLGIGTVVPEIAGLPELLSDVRSAASKVIEIQTAHARTMHEMTWLCFNHIKHKFPGEDTAFRGGLFRIQITAKAATFQILFLVGHGLYAPSHEIPLSDIDGKDVLKREPFSQLPLNMLIPNDVGHYVPVTYDGWKKLLENTPLNSKSKKQMYRSHTADVLESFEGMVEELMAA